MDGLIKYLEVRTGKSLAQQDIDQMSPVVLAYIGDTVYDIFVRTYLVIESNMPVNKLHNRAVELVRAKAQSEALLKVDGLLDDSERYIVKRGRNAKSANIPTNADMMEYRRATAFEALLGYLYLNGRQERIYEILGYALGIEI